MKQVSSVCGRTGLKVAMVSEHASPLAVIGGIDAGGQNVHVAALACQLGRLGCEVVVHVRRDEPSLPRRVPLAPNVVVDHVDAGPATRVSKDDLLPYMDDFAADLQASWELDPPDVVHAHFWMSGRASLTAAAPLGLPVLQTFHALGTVKRRHQGLADTSPRSRLAEERAIVAAVDRIVATCDDEVVELCRIGADASRIDVVPCGVDLNLFRPRGPVAARRSAGHRLVAVGRLVERKGVADIVRALPALPDAELVVAGGPGAEDLELDPEARRLQALAQDLGVADRLVLLGRVERGAVPALLRSADVVVCAPWYEPFGIVPLEAMACGVPVVATAVGGMLDTVVHDVTGLHVPPREPAAIAAAVSALLEDPRLRRRMGTAGARRARRRYGWEEVARATLDSYESVLHATVLTGVARR